MFRLHRFHKVVIVIFLAVFSLVLVWFYELRKPSEPVSDQIFTLVSNCRKERSYLPCVKTRIKDLLRSHDSGIVLSEVERLFHAQEKNGDQGWVTCHDLAHVFGELTVESGTPVGTALATCSKSCGFGCAHGALFASVKKSAVQASSFSAVCDMFLEGYPPQEYDACIHGFGHAVAELAQKNISESLHFCSSLASQARFKCAAGVFMEIIGTQESPGDYPYTDMQSFCHDIPESYNAVCAEQTGENSMNRTRNPLTAWKECAAVPLRYRPQCVTSLANIFYYQVDGSEQEILRFCGSLPSDMHAACYLGIIQSDVISNRTATHSVGICSALSGAARSTCFGELGAKSEYVYGSVTGKTLCDTLSESDRLPCLSGQIIH